MKAIYNARRRRTISAAITLLSLSASLASAQNPLTDARIPQRTVGFADLNTSKHEGIEKLYWRIRAAAKAICIEPETRELQRKSAGRRCQDQAIERAVGDVNLPRLTAYHRGRSDAREAPGLITAKT
jgi:UrcA family protein